MTAQLAAVSAVTVNRELHGPLEPAVGARSPDLLGISARGSDAAHRNVAPHMIRLLPELLRHRVWVAQRL
jgi:hypothetical protein